MNQQTLDFIYDHFWIVPTTVFILGWIFFYILGKIIIFVEHFNETERGKEICFNILAFVSIVFPIVIVTFFMYKICQELL